MFSYLIRPFCFRLIAILALLFFVACGGAVNNHSNNPQAGRLNATVFDNNTVTLDWRLQGESFTVTHSTNEASSTITVTSSQYTFSNLAPNSKHSFIVRSDTGEQALAYAYTGANIAQPSKISAIAFDSSAELAWEALPNVSSYTLYRSAQELSGYELYGTFNGSSALVTGLNNGQSYYFKVSANSATASQSSLTRSVTAGESFGEVTVVTPSTGDDDYPHIFKGYLRDGKYVHFMWDAVAGAMGYAISSAASDAGSYTLVALTNDNFYDLNLPVDDRFYRVAALFPDMSYGTPSQHIELKFRTPAVWTAIGGLGAINVNMVNFDSYSSVMLACKGVNEDEWFDTELTHVPFNAGWLEPMDYDCKLTLLYSDSIREESDTKRVTVYPMPDPDEFISIYVWERNADLVWNATGSNDKYSVLLQSKGGNLEVVADDLSNTQYTLTDLLCDNEYVAYVVNKTTSVLSSPVEFKLDSGFCALNPDSVEREGINKITKLNNAPFARQYFGDLSVIGDKVYLFGGSTGNVTLMGDTWVYDPSLSDGTWTKLSTANAPSPRDIYASAVLNDKLYIFGGRGGSGDTWEFDPATNIWTNLMIPAPAAVDTVNAIDYKGKIYMFDSTGKTFVLDTIAKTWTQRASYSSAFPFHKKPTVIGNYIYFFGGAAENPPRRAGSDLWRYSPESDTWKQLNPTGTVLARHTHAITTYNNKIYVWAGDGGNHAFLNSIQVYDPSDGSDGSWKQVIPEGALPTSRRGSSITNMNGKLYLFAGYNGATLNDFYIYEP